MTYTLYYKYYETDKFYNFYAHCENFFALEHIMDCILIDGLFWDRTFLRIKSNDEIIADDINHNNYPDKIKHLKLIHAIEE